MHLVGFIIRIYHDARSPERQIYLMHETKGDPKFSKLISTVKFSLHDSTREPDRGPIIASIPARTILPTAITLLSNAPTLTCSEQD